MAELKDWLPQEPSQGPPLPKWLEIKWPWMKQEKPPKSTANVNFSLSLENAPSEANQWKANIRYQKDGKTWYMISKEQYTGTSTGQSGLQLISDKMNFPPLPSSATVPVPYYLEIYPYNGQSWPWGMKELQLKDDLTGDRVFNWGEGTLS